MAADGDVVNAAARLLVQEYATARADVHPVQLEQALRRGLRAYWLRLAVTYAVVAAVVVVLAGGSFVAAASRGGSTSGSFSVTPAEVTVAVGERQRLTAVRPSGDEVSGTVRWSSADPAVAQVDGAGVVVASGAGSTTITARVGDDRATVGVVVTAAPETGIEIVPGSVDVDVRGQVQLTAVRPSGEDVTRSVQWTTADPSVAEVTSTGVVVGRSQGKTTITARLGEDDATTGVSVRTAVRGVSVTPSTVETCLQSGDQPQLKAEATYTNGRREDVTSRAVWTSDDEDVAVVDGGGRVRFTGEGTTTIRASLEGEQGTATVRADFCVE